METNQTIGMLQNPQAGSGAQPTPTKKKRWIIRKPWYIAIPIYIFTALVLVALLTYGYAAASVFLTTPLSDLSKAPHINEYQNDSNGRALVELNEFSAPSESINVSTLWHMAPWVDARGSFTKNTKSQYAPGTYPKFWESKTAQWHYLRWGVSCKKAGGEIAYSSGMGGNTYYCVTGRYADAGNSCSTNEECISKKCMHQDDSDDLICVGPKCRHCAYYENWNGPNMIDR